MKRGEAKDMAGRPNVRGKVGEQLLAAGLITEIQLEAALERQRETGGFLGDVLIKMGFVRSELVGEILSANMAVPFVSLSHSFLDPTALDLVGEDYQRQHLIL